ncbi:hypothetical protein Daus18300_000457 [Diaporthe australafricana]|uniref:Uncharacterized protein n=1 Tax=Diaporthe australafricana TaxID=127596 RepID=A0ABR3Y3J4_9PEZI
MSEPDFAMPDLDLSDVADLDLGMAEPESPNSITAEDILKDPDALLRHFNNTMPQPLDRSIPAYVAINTIWDQLDGLISGFLWPPGFQESLSSYEVKIKEAVDLLYMDAGKCGPAARETKQLRAEKDDLQQQVETLTHYNSTFQAVDGELRGQIETLEQYNEEFQTVDAELRGQVGTLQSQLEELQAEADHLGDEIEMLELELEELRAEKDEICSQLEALNDLACDGDEVGELEVEQPQGEIFELYGQPEADAPPPQVESSQVEIDQLGDRFKSLDVEVRHELEALAPTAEESAVIIEAAPRQSAFKLGNHHNIYSPYSPFSDHRAVQQLSSEYARQYLQTGVYEASAQRIAEIQWQNMASWYPESGGTWDPKLYRPAPGPRKGTR